MKAFLNDDKGLGSDHSAVTNEYKTISGMFRFAIVPFQKSHGFCRAEIHMNWDTRYGDPDRVETYDGFTRTVEKGVFLWR